MSEIVVNHLRNDQNCLFTTHLLLFVLFASSKTDELDVLINGEPLTKSNKMMIL